MSKTIYPHNDLLNAAYHLLEGIENKVQDGNENGITLDCIACVVVSAAAAEGIVNALGHLRVEDWKERDNAPTKLKRIYEVAKIEFDETTSPLEDLKRLRDLRNSVMHCQPEISDGTDTPANESSPLDAVWLPCMTPEYCRTCFDSIKLFQRQIFEALQISEVEAMSFAIRDH